MHKLQHIFSSRFQIILAIFVCLFVVIFPTGRAFAANDPLALEFTVNENRIDGCTDCGCKMKGELNSKKKQRWWITFGLAEPGTEDGAAWQALDASSRCGIGEFNEVEDGFTQTIGTPYVIVELSTQAKRSRKSGLTIETETIYRKLAGFGGTGKAEYDRRSISGQTTIEGKEGIVIPVFLPDAAEQVAFPVNEVLLDLRASDLNSVPEASYGTISVTADVPGAGVLLDGGFVGRITEGEPLLIGNVPTGKRELQVTDFSGRSVSDTVKVNEGHTSDVSLGIMRLSDADLARELAPLGKNPQGFEEYWRTKDGAVVIDVPAGSFLMGSPEGQGDANEHPQHTVDVGEYLVDKNEVTWRQFKKYSKATGAVLPTEPFWGIKPNYPVNFVLWKEAKDYCEWAGGQLPTEAQWEKAARGTDGRIYPWGDQWDASRCNSLSGSLHRPESAGSFPNCISPYGALDMAGSMWEWTLDPYKPYADSSTDENEQENVSGRILYVKRGGSWVNQQAWLRTAYRVKSSPTSRNMDHGFRCVMPAEGLER